MAGYPFFDQPQARPGQMPTIGSAQAYQAPPLNMGDIQAQYEQAQRQQQLAQTLMQAGYVPNSGGLGALAQIAQAFAGRKLSRKADESVASALRRESEYKLQTTSAEIARAAAAETVKYQRDRTDKRADQQWEVDHRAAPAAQWHDNPDGSGGYYTPPTTQPQPQQPPVGGVRGNVLAAIEQQESGGNPNAVSPKGARGPMQLMPGTQRDPGFGVQPARDDSPEENRRMGADYFNAMLKRYNGNQSLALAAYNAGPGRVDDALKQSQFDPQRALAMLPKETQDYVPGVQNRMSGGSPAAPAPQSGYTQMRGPQSKEETFGQPQEVKGKDGKPLLAQIGNRGTVRPIDGYGVPDNAQSANKEEMQRQRMVAQLSKRLADDQVPLLETQLGTIEKTLGGYTDPKGHVNKDIPGFGQWDSLVPTAIAGTEAQDLRQQVQGLSNVILKSRSGAAVTDNELRRFLVESGQGKVMPEQQLVNGMKLIRHWFDAQKSNIRGGYSPDIVQSYYDNAPENIGLFDTKGAAPKKAPAAGGWSIQEIH